MKFGQMAFVKCRFGRFFFWITKETAAMYVYQLLHDDYGDIKVIGYFGSWKKARQVMKKYRSSIAGFKDYPTCFSIKKIRINED